MGALGFLSTPTAFWELAVHTLAREKILFGTLVFIVQCGATLIFFLGGLNSHILRMYGSASTMHKSFVIFSPGSQAGTKDVVIFSHGAAE